MTERPRLSGFAEACYDQNSVEDLIESLVGPGYDSVDCRTWALSPGQWRRAIADALLARIIDRHRLPESSDET